MASSINHACPLNEGVAHQSARLEISLEGYLSLVDWTGRMLRDDDKVGVSRLRLYQSRAALSA